MHVLEQKAIFHDVLVILQRVQDASPSAGHLEQVVAGSAVIAVASAVAGLVVVTESVAVLAVASAVADSNPDLAVADVAKEAIAADDQTDRQWKRVVDRQAEAVTCSCVEHKTHSTQKSPKTLELSTRRECCADRTDTVACQKSSSAPKQQAG